MAWGRVAKSATFGVQWASDESFCPSTVGYHNKNLLVMILILVSHPQFRRSPSRDPDSTNIVKTLVVRYLRRRLYLRIYSQEVLKRVSAFLCGIKSAIRTLLDLINRHTQFY